MTIAGCFLTPGGVVLGADSTQTFHMGSHVRHFDHAQKLFEIGENSTLGIVTWGYGGGLQLSFRRVVAELADSAADRPFTSVEDTAERWVDHLWPFYSQDLSQTIDMVKHLDDKTDRSPKEDQELRQLRQNASVGFCLAGHVLPNRTSRAFVVQFEPAGERPRPAEMPMGEARFWGMPNLVTRLTVGIDPGLADTIAKSPHWTGSQEDLVALLPPFYLGAPQLQLLPIREAIDYMHSIISTTCKGLKFSRLSPTCGGHIEIAVITADRRFRWVSHKDLGRAIDS